MNLNDMILEANVFLFLSGSVFNIENTDKVSSPASNNSIENLKQYA